MHRPIRQLLEAFLGEIPAGAASIRQGVDESENDYLEVCPRNPRAARIRALDQGGEYVLGIGRGTIVEVALEPAGTRGLGRGSGEEKFLEICRAVAKGGFVERVSVILGRNLFVYGRINLNGRPIRSFSGLPLFPCWRTLRYEPY